MGALVAKSAPSNSTLVSRYLREKGRQKYDKTDEPPVKISLTQMSRPVEWGRGISIEETLNTKRWLQDYSQRFVFK